MQYADPSNPIPLQRVSTLEPQTPLTRMFSSPVLYADSQHMDIGYAMAYDIMMAQEQGENQVGSAMDVAPPLSLGEAHFGTPSASAVFQPMGVVQQVISTTEPLIPGNVEQPIGGRWERAKSVSVANAATDYMGFLANQKRKSYVVDEGEEAAATGATSATLSPGRASIHSSPATPKVLTALPTPPAPKPSELLKKVDLRSFHVPQLQAFNHPCNITIIDYSKDEVAVTDELDNDDFITFLQTTDRPAWSKVRWINLEGLSYDVIRMLAIAYHLHPLAVEDMVSSPRRVKADYYSDSLFVCAALVSLMDPSLGATGVLSRNPNENAKEIAERSGEQKRRRSMDTYKPTPLPPYPVNDLDGLPSDVGIGTGLRPSDHPHRTESLPGRYSAEEGHESMRTPLQFTWGRTRPLENDPRDKFRWCNCGVEAVNIFMTRDGTVISFFQDEGDSVTVPVTNRITQPKTLLRTSEDPSFLVMALLDSIVDHSTRIVGGYADEVSSLELAIFNGPKALYTKQLHLLENELVNLKRVLVPTRNIISQLKTERFPQGANEEDWEPMSELTRFYLSDVLDHADSAVEDIHDLEKECGEQVELVFNTINHDTNNSLKLLSVVSLVFLPMTFVAGTVYWYKELMVLGMFGTNFEPSSPYDWEWSFQLIFYVLCAVLALVFYYLAESYMFGRLGHALKPKPKVV
jgi:Mg2+ and Co2+ transporter CorA